jgi:hypothetical protein
MRFPYLNAAVLSVLLTAGAALAAQTPAPGSHPIQFGQSEIDCSSFLTATPPAGLARIAGNAEAMEMLDFSPGDRLQLSDVHGLQPGMELRVLRIDDHWGEFEQFDGQHQQLKAMGHRVESVGRLRILSTRGTTALARVEAACRPLHTGDFGVAWQARTAPAQVMAPAFDVADIPDAASLSGSGVIAAARDSAYEVGTEDEIYLNRGTGQGAHPGQFWLIVRGPNSASQKWLKDVTRGLDVPEGYGKSTPMATDEKGDGLAHVIGQAVVLWAEPSSSTAIVTAADTAIYPGDQVIPMP